MWTLAIFGVVLTSLVDICKFLCLEGGGGAKSIDEMTVNHEF